MAQPTSMIGKLFYRVWKTVDVAGRFMIGIIAVVIFFFMLRGCVSGPDLPEVTKGSALVLNPRGVIVEQAASADPVDQFIQRAQGITTADTSVYDILDAIEYAKDDSDISTLVINPNGLMGVYSGINKYQDIRAALEDFKTSGKKIVAISDGYSQNQYYFSSVADEIYMNPYGSLMFTGMGRNGTYYKSALEKFGVNVHVFRVGTFKSAVEPYLRDDMSEAAKEANLEWMGDLWGMMKTEIAASRGKTVAEFDDFVDNYLPKFQAANGDGAQLAVQEGFVDKLMSRGEFRQYMIDKVGLNSSGKSYKSISYKTYLKAKRPTIELPGMGDKVAVVIAAGEIVNGYRKEGTIGGDSTAALIRKARMDDSVKAIVLRVDSPGGSAFASEIIRAELERAQQEGKIVVASMAGVAASGGYWISATSDEIWAHPSTITGSIGIFSMIPTFEKPLNELGIHFDGVGTTKWSRSFDVTSGISDEYAQVLQAGIEEGYDRFLTLVANGRDMTKEDVDKIAQGRVWSGLDAHRLGLVDKLGDLDDAIESAAKLANIEDYSVKVIKRELDSQELLIKQLLGNVSSDVELEALAQEFAPQPNPILMGLSSEIQDLFNLLQNMNDPNHAYAHCMCVLD